MREKANELKIAIRQYKNMRVKNCAKLVEKSSVSQGETSSSTLLCGSLGYGVYLKMKREIGF